MNKSTFKKILIIGCCIIVVLVTAIYSIQRSKANAKEESLSSVKNEAKIEFTNEINQDFLIDYQKAINLASQGQNLINQGNLIADSAFSKACSRMKLSVDDYKPININGDGTKWGVIKLTAEEKKLREEEKARQAQETNNKK